MVECNDLIAIEEQEVSSYMEGLQSQFQDHLNLLDLNSISKATNRLYD